MREKEAAKGRRDGPSADEPRWEGGAMIFLLSGNWIAADNAGHAFAEVSTFALATADESARQAGAGRLLTL